MTPHPTLLSIIAYARSGALDHACRLFLEGGFELVDDDPAVLSVRGRLLKDRALAAQGAERRRLYRESAEAYARAGELGGQTYPLINAATLSLLAGRREQSLALAKKLLAKIEAGGDELETPYYRGATHAEALLLLGKIAQARAAFAAAIALAPRAYEDHASTLRQFGMILEALGEDAAWLDPLRPPRALHFAAHTSRKPPVSLVRRLRALVKAERIGFAYGTLATRADAAMAEALLKDGVELHLVLPAPVDGLPSSIGTPKVLDVLLRRAASVRIVTGAADARDAQAMRLADVVAMGCALMQADTLMSEAVQCAVPGPQTASAVRLWKAGGHRQALLGTAPAAKRSRAGAATGGPVVRAAMLRIDLAGHAPAALAKTVLPRLARALAKGPTPLLAPRWTGEAVLVAYDGTVRAAEAALGAATALAGIEGTRIAGHYALVHRVRDAFGGKPFLTGPATSVLAQTVRSTPAGAIHLTGDFAAALHVESGRARPRTEYVGDLPGADGERAVRLFSLKHPSSPARRG